MRASQRFGSAPAVRSIVNAHSTNGDAPQVLTAAQAAYATRAGLSAALSAGVLSTALSISGSGSGYLDIFAATSVDATSRTHRVKITIDGTVVFDATTAAVSQADGGIVPVGNIVTSASTKTIMPFPMRFVSSCLVEYASSLGETAKTNYYYAYRLA